MGPEKAGIAAKLRDMRVLDGVRAIAPGQSTGKQPASMLPEEGVVDARQAEMFEKAGWTFVRRKHGGAPGTDHGVAVDRDGRLKILSPSLTVKFDPRLSSDDVAGILQPLGLKIRRRLGFAPNLYLVSGDENTIARASELNERDDVIYAEPVMIEALQAR